MNHALNDLFLFHRFDCRRPRTVDLGAAGLGKYEDSLVEASAVPAQFLKYYARANIKTVDDWSPLRAPSPPSRFRLLHGHRRVRTFPLPPSRKDSKVHAEVAVTGRDPGARRPPGLRKLFRSSSSYSERRLAIAFPTPPSYSPCIARY